MDEFISVKQQYLERKSERTIDNVKSIFEIFITNMGYDKKVFVEDNDFSALGNYAYKFVSYDKQGKKQSIIIELTIDNISQTSIRTFYKKIKKSDYTWGIFINGNDYLLFYKDINDEGWSGDPTVLHVKMQGEYGKEYFRFFSFENLFVSKNTLYFCDVLRFKINGFKGSETSWRAYESSIKRFLLYMIQLGNEYDFNQYNKLEINDFVKYIRSTTGQNGKVISAPTTVENSYRHISAFIHYICENNKEFNKSITEVINCFSDYKQKMIGNIFQEECLEQVVSYIKTQRYGKRNLVIFYLCLCLGLERNKLCQLKWEHRESDMIKIDGKDKIVPVYVNKLLDELYEENKKRNLPLDYIFYTFKGEKGVPIKPGTINDIFTNIGKIDLDNKIFSQYDPANIRKALAEYLFVEQHMNLVEVMDLLDIDVNNVGRYITNEMIDTVLGFMDGSRDCKHNPVDDLIRKIDKDC